MCWKVSETVTIDWRDQQRVLILSTFGEAEGATSVTGSANHWNGNIEFAKAFTVKFNFEADRGMRSAPRLIRVVRLLAVAGLSAAAVSAQFTYETNQNTITITRYTGSESVVSIPAEIDGLPVRRIGDGAFLHSDVNDVVISEGVTSIGRSAFHYCRNLVRITLPGTLNDIGENAFTFSALPKVEIPEGVTDIGPSAFSGTLLTNITIPNSVTNIGASAFSGCSSLLSAKIPDSVTFLGGSVFYSCSALTNVTVGNSVPNIGETAFFRCGRLGSVTLGANVAEIGTAAFFECTNLTSIVLPQGLTNIGERVFLGCIRLGSVVIPDSVVSIGRNAFSQSGLTSVNVPPGVKAVGDFGFFGCTNLGSATLPESLEDVADGLFRGCSSLTNVAMGNSVAGIGSDAFRECSSLETITLPDSITILEEAAFAYCSNLVRIDLPGNLLTIQNIAFYYCLSLEEVRIPRGVLEIGAYAFTGCTNLNRITVDAQNTRFASVDGVLFDNGPPGSRLIQYPPAKPGSYAVPEGVTAIGSAAFFGSGRMTNVTFPVSLTDIGDQAFAGCVNLENITIPENVRSIGAEAFTDCGRLEGIYFKGNPPTMTGSATSFSGAVLYYLPGFPLWAEISLGRPTVLWNPEIAQNDGSFGVKDGKFGFTITGTADIVVVVETSRSLENPAWARVGRYVLAGGSAYFTDPQWRDFPKGFYRLSSP